MPRLLPPGLLDRAPVRYLPVASLSTDGDGTPVVTPRDGAASESGGATLVIRDRLGVGHYFHFVEHLIAGLTLQHWLQPDRPFRAVFLGGQTWDVPRARFAQRHLLTIVLPEAEILVGTESRPAEHVFLVDPSLAVTRINKLLDPISRLAPPALHAIRSRVFARLGIRHAPPRAGGLRARYVRRIPPRTLGEADQDVLLKRLSRAGFAVSEVEFGDLEWADQVRLMGETDLLVGVHGNGLTNLVWMPPHGVTLELFPAGVHHYDYQIFSEIAGLGYFGIEGAEDGFTFREFSRHGPATGHGQSVNAPVTHLPEESLDAALDAIRRHFARAEATSMTQPLLPAEPPAPLPPPVPLIAPGLSPSPGPAVLLSAAPARPTAPQMLPARPAPVPERPPGYRRRSFTTRTEESLRAELAGIAREHGHEAAVGVRFVGLPADAMVAWFGPGGGLEIQVAPEMPNAERRDFYTNRWMACVPLFLATRRRHPDATGGVCLWLDDAPAGPGLAFCGNSASHVLVPDPVFMETGGYWSFRSEVGQGMLAWPERVDQVFWRGASTGLRRIDHYEVRRWQDLPRFRLALAARDLGDGFDIGINDVVQIWDPSERAEIAAAGIIKDGVPQAHFGRYRYAIDIDGNTSSWPGLFSKLLLGVTVLKVDSPPGWRQWYYDRLVPGRNFVPLTADFARLPAMLQWLRSNAATAQSIAQRGQELAGQLGYDAVLEDMVPRIRMMIG